MRESQDARAFRKLYHGLFPRAPEDSLSNYTHLRTLVSQKQSKGDVQIDLVRSILGPTSRGYGGMQVVLKSIAVTPRTSAKALREAAIHRAVSLSWTSEARVLPLLSHFITHVLPGEGVDKDEASSSSSSSNGKRTSTPRATSTYLVLVFPFLEQGTLFDWVAKKMTSKLWRQKIGEDELRWVIVEAALALQRCHERGVVHRDVKAENILVDTLHGTPKLRLADFGMSIWIDEMRESEGKAVEDQGDSTLCGTWDYLSPETATQRRTGPPSDAWALGCVCVWLLTGSTPFADDKSHDQIVDRIAVGNWEAARAQLPDTLSYECLDLLEGMLQVDIGERITVQRILRHPFLKPELPRRTIIDSVGGAVQRTRGARLRMPRASTPPSRSERSGRKDRRDLKMNVLSGERSSTTQTQTPMSLRSAMVKIQTELNVVDKAKEKDGRPRRTPFGVVRLPASSSSPVPPQRPALRTISPGNQPAMEKGRDAIPSQRDRSEEQEKEAELALTQRKRADASTTWGGGLGTRGIPPLRQRTGDGGRTAITPDGSVVVVTRMGEPPRQQMTTFVIDATGSILTDCRSTTPKVHRVSGGLDPFLENIYKGACRWLDRVRARTIVAAFTLPPDEKETKDEALPTAACLVRANRDFAVSWQGTHGVLQGSIEVDVRRTTGMISMTTLLQSFPTPDDCGKTQSTAKRYALPIASTRDGSWTCSSLQDDADDEVSKREKLAARKALACARAVDGVFAGLPWM